MITREDIQAKLKSYVKPELLQQFMQQLSQTDVDAINAQLLQNGKYAAMYAIYNLYNNWETANAKS